MRRPLGPCYCLAIVLLASPAMATATEILFLSGTGYGDTVDWEFRCTGGRRAGTWTTIPVPSHWELEGFGTYNYGHDDDKSREEGHYRHRFHLPERFHDRHVELVFEGVMTDAEVRLNGHPAGPVHQGAFYRFRYDVTTLLEPGASNLLEVTVRKHSANRRVNRAERDADYWIFGGIFRPVWLEALPPESIAHLAVDARHDGRLTLEVETRGLDGPARLVARVLTREGEAVAVLGGDAAARTRLQGRVEEPRPWSAEDPHLYRLEVELRRGEAVLHRESRRFGFRTVEVRPGDGLYVNGRRVRLRGVNRHAFWPDSGRTLNAVLDRRDVELMKRMNLNAVRTSHYPPDASFLDAADELGLYVIDELAGWHDAYDTATGTLLVAEMVRRDAHHPSILFWANGNEGGTNPALDEVFHRHDLQRRPVLHPDVLAAGIETAHYPDWEELGGHLEGGWLGGWLGAPPLYLPTEFLHGLYDGGSGASLEDYWRRMQSTPRGLGGFLWAFTDEAVARSDREGELDTDGNHAPDGLLGPYRELSANFWAVRQTFAPVAVVDAELGDAPFVELENRFDATSLAACHFRWAWLRLPGPRRGAAPEELARGWTPGPAAAPGERRRLELPPPGEAADALRLDAFAPSGRALRTWVLPRLTRRQLARREVTPGTGAVSARTAGGQLVLTTPEGTTARWDLASGELVELARDGARLPLAGPRPIPAARSAERVTVRHWSEADGHLVEARAGERWWRFKLFPSGWLRLSAQYAVRGELAVFGLGFDFPEERLETFEWLGLGPTRLWKNRRQGTLGVWHRRPSASTPIAAAHEPKSAGYFGEVHWARLALPDGVLTVLPGDGLDLGVLRPPFPADARDARAAVPELPLAFLNGIAPIGTKFHPADELGPEGRPHTPDGLHRATVFFFLSQPDA